jgi:hypothetical protein
MFKNTSALGAFGEHVYQNFCEIHGFFCKRTNYCHTDFHITRKRDHISIFVDVKSTLSRRNGYHGKRFHDEIAYETIAVWDGRVVLIPDQKSPHHNQGSYDLGPLDTLYDQWKKNPKKNQRKKSFSHEHRYHELKSLFDKSQYPRVRLVERGDASSKRWTGTVDNLPGGAKAIDDNDATLFIQYDCQNFQQVISKIMLFPHDLIHSGKIQMAKPNARQINKGITQVIDLKSFSNDFPSFVFPDIKSLMKFLG